MKCIMQKKLIAVLGGILIFAGTAYGDLYDTEFLGGDVLDGARWTDGVPAGGAHGLMAEDGTISAVGDMNWYGNDGGTTITIDGGHISRTDGNLALRVLQNSFLTVNSGSLTNQGGLSFNRAGFELNDGSIDVNFLNFYGSGEGSAFGGTVNGGTLTVNELRLFNAQTATKHLHLAGGNVIVNDQVRFTGSTTDGYMTIAGGSLTVSGSTPFDTWGDGYIDFLEESISLASLTVTGFGLSDYETLYSQNRIRFDGSNEGNFSAHFSVTDDTLSVIPEPSAGLLMALFGGVFIWWRRARLHG